MGHPAQTINEIVKGKKKTTAEAALQLERVLGVPAHIWLGLEATYRQALARRTDARRLARDATPAAAFPYAALARLGWVEKTRETSARIEQLLRFFGVGSLAQVPAAADIFWLSLSHELGHLLLHGRTALFVEQDDAAHDDREAEADALAREHLIPSREWAAFLGAHTRPAAAAVEAFARRLAIAPGIAVGRLHHEERIPHSDLNGLRRQRARSAPGTGGAPAGRTNGVAMASR